MPMTLSGRLVTAASRVTEIDEVLVAMIASGLATPSSCANSLSLRSRFSVAASITKSASRNAPMSVDVRIRASANALSASLSFSRLTRRSRLPSTVFSARSNCAAAISVRITGCPATANAWAMPLPMVPAPTIPIALFDMCTPSGNNGNKMVSRVMSAGHTQMPSTACNATGSS